MSFRKEIGIGLLLCTLTLAGCSRHFFTVTGQAGTDGPAFGTWTSTPQGCSRDPIDGLPAQRTSTVASFFWQDVTPLHRTGQPLDAPEQLNLLRGPNDTWNVRLKTVQTGGWLIHPADCTRLEIETHEQPPAFPGGQSSLAGTAHLACTVKQSRVWADLKFSRCDY